MLDTTTQLYFSRADRAEMGLGLTVTLSPERPHCECRRRDPFGIKAHVTRAGRLLCKHELATLIYAHLEHRCTAPVMPRRGDGGALTPYPVLLPYG